jgi:steroid delta-isomerase-like uncharacterized protein
MSDHDLKSCYRAYVNAIWDQKNLDAMESFFTDDHIDHMAPPGQAPGIAGLRQTFAMFFEAFPDWQISIDDMIAEGDKLVVRISYTATHRGPFFGIPATGRQIRSGGTHTLRYVGNKIAEHWGHSDDLGMMQQLGVIQMPGQ